jgi:hypothetical protein
MCTVPQGKKVGQHSYFHVQWLDALSPTVCAQIEAATKIAQVSPDDDFNVVKFSDSTDSITLLSYPDFFDEAFPVLAAHWTVDLKSGTCRYRIYADSLNPPILHRKELLLSPDHAQQDCRRPFAGEPWN